MTRDEFALALGYEGTIVGNRETIRRMENGVRDVPLKTARLAWMFVQHGIPTQWPAGLEAQVEEESGV